MEKENYASIEQLTKDKTVKNEYKEIILSKGIEIKGLNKTFKPGELIQEYLEKSYDSSINKEIEHALILYLFTSQNKVYTSKDFENKKYISKVLQKEKINIDYANETAENILGNLLLENEFYFSYKKHFESYKFDDKTKQGIVKLLNNSQINQINDNGNGKKENNTISTDFTKMSDLIFLGNNRVKSTINILERKFDINGEDEMLRILGLYYFCKGEINQENADKSKYIKYKLLKNNQTYYEKYIEKELGKYKYAISSDLSKSIALEISLYDFDFNGTGDDETQMRIFMINELTKLFEKHNKVINKNNEEFILVEILGNKKPDRDINFSIKDIESKEFKAFMNDIEQNIKQL